MSYMAPWISRTFYSLNIEIAAAENRILPCLDPAKTLPHGPRPNVTVPRETKV